LSIATYSPAHDEAYYEGLYFDHTPYGPEVAVVRFAYVEEPEYTVDPEAGLDWQEDVLASGGHEDVGWGDEADRARTAKLILRHYLDRDPGSDELAEFLDEFSPALQDGQPWTIHAGELQQRLGL
jgi:hypothetical protein